MIGQLDKPLPAAAADALAHGRVVEAVKIVREGLGLSLKDAHALVHRHAVRIGHAGTDDGADAAVPMLAVGGGELVFPPEAVDAMQRGEFIQAIALVRGANPHLDLKSAKHAIEQLGSGSAVGGAKATRMPASQRVPTVVEGDRGGARSLMVAGFVVLAVLAWWLFGRG